MADKITTSSSLTVECETYLVNENDGTVSDTDTKIAKIVIPDPRTSLTESQIKTAMNNYIKPSDTTVSVYLYESMSHLYSYTNSASNTSIQTAYTTSETVTAIDIGYED